MSVSFPHSLVFIRQLNLVDTGRKGLLSRELGLKDGGGAESKQGQAGTGPEQGWATPVPGFLSPRSLRKGGAWFSIVLTRAHTEPAGGPYLIGAGLRK